MFRLHYDQPEPVKQFKEIEEALNYWNEMNTCPSCWASFSAEFFKHELIVEVKVGRIHHKGTDKEHKETANKIRHFFENNNGVVGIYDSVYP